MGYLRRWAFWSFLALGCARAVHVRETLCTRGFIIRLIICVNGLLFYLVWL